MKQRKTGKMSLRKSLVMNSDSNQLYVIYKVDWNQNDIPLFEASYDACVRWCEKRNWIWNQE